MGLSRTSGDNREKYPLIHVMFSMPRAEAQPTVQWEHNFKSASSRLQESSCSHKLKGFHDVHCLRQRYIMVLSTKNVPEDMYEA